MWRAVRTAVRAQPRVAVAVAAAAAPRVPAHWPAVRAARAVRAVHIEPRLQLSFTCKVPDCGTRSTHEFARKSYTDGVVIVQCPGCKNRHLIADNLGWFAQGRGEPKTIEEIVAARGGKVQRGTKYADGEGGETIEIES